MAVGNIHQPYQQLTGKILSRLELEGFELTESSKVLVEMMSRAWIEEPPEGVEEEYPSSNDKIRIAETILEAALEDPHFLSSSPLKAFDLLAGVVDSGRNILKDILLKGP